MRQPGRRPSLFYMRLCAQTVLLLTLLFLFIGCKEEEKPEIRQVVRPVKMMQVVAEDNILNRSYPGRVRAAKRVDLAFQVGGPLIELQVDEGQEVKKGELLARIDPRNFKTDLLNAEGRLARANASLSSAQSEYDRIKRIRQADPGAASESMLVRRLEAVATASADIAALTASVQAAQNRLDDTRLTAPFDGYISKRHVENFQEVRAQEPIFSLDFLSQLEIIVDIPETIMASLQGQQRLDLYAEFAAAPGRQFPLSTKEYSTRADSTTQTYQIVLVMDQPDDINILPGMTATVNGSFLLHNSDSAALFIPAHAVFAGNTGESQVWVVDMETMTVHLRAVQTGELLGEDNISIEGGLEAGDVVVLTGVTLLREGMQVRDLSQLEGYGK